MKKEAMELWWIDLLKSLCFIILVLSLIHLNDAKQSLVNVVSHRPEYGQ